MESTIHTHKTQLDLRRVLTHSLHRGHLVQVVRQEYPRWLNYFIYAMMEIAVIGSDIQAIDGDRWR